MIDHDIGDVRNTRSMDMRPQSPEHYVNLSDKSEENKPIRLKLIVSGDVFTQKTGYAVIVECWEKKNYGRVRRAWLETFSEAERNKLAKWYGKLYKWHLVSGVPAQVGLDTKTLELLIKAANFFAQNT